MMGPLRGFTDYLAGSAGRVAAAVVLLGGFLLAIFIARTFVVPLPGEFRCDFGSARWIQKMHAAPPEAAYFRKNLYVSGPIVLASIEISATGTYQLYVNDLAVGASDYPGVRPAGVYDLKTLLSPGRNTVAIYVAGGYYPGPAQIRVRGVYQVASSPPQEFISDSSWKVSGTPDGVLGGYPWTSPRLDDLLWANAYEAASGERFSTVQRVSYDPLLLHDLANANWIGPRAQAATQVSFAYGFDLPPGTREAWLQVATTGAYDLVINGRLAAIQSPAPRAIMTGPLEPIIVPPERALEASRLPKVITPNSPVVDAGVPAVISAPPRNSARTMALVVPRSVIPVPSGLQIGITAGMPDLMQITPPQAPAFSQLIPMPLALGLNGGTPLLVAYDIFAFVKPGKNSLVVTVRPDIDPPVLLADLFLQSNIGLKRYGTDASWHTLTLAGPKPNPEDGAVLLSSYQASSWGPLPQVQANPQSLPGYNSRILFLWIAVIGATGTIVVLLWFLVPLLGASIVRRPLEQMWTYDAALHLPALTLALALLLLSYDVRFAGNWCFRPRFVAMLVVVLIASRVMILLPPARRDPSRWPVRYQAGARYLKLCALGMIVVVALLVRSFRLTQDPIGHDEANMVRYSWGVLKQGFPYIIGGSYKRPLATYELVTYPIALSSVIFGQNPLAWRLPAILFGTAAVGLIGWAGFRIFDWRAGLLCAVIYGFLPSTIGWSRDGFYPAQESFFALLTFWLFFEAIRGRELNYRFLTYAAIAFVAAYFSWEGSGFILPVLVIATLVVRWGDFRWMWDGYLWRTVLVVSAIVILQLCRRELVLVPDYLGVVYDLSQVTTPGLVFLQKALFNPSYYLRALFFAENHFLLTVLMLTGLVFARQSTPLRYLCSALLSLEFFYSVLLPNYAPRYSYNAIALLVLAGVGSFLSIADRLDVLWEGLKDFAIARLARSGVLAVVASVLIAGTNPFILKTYRLSWDPENPLYLARLGPDFKPEYTPADRLVARRRLPGDIVISVAPHVYSLDNWQYPDFSLNAALAKRMYYDGGLRQPIWTDKWLNGPTIRGLEELEDLQSRAARIWLIIPTFDDRSFIDPAVAAYLHKHAQVIYETSEQQVLLISALQSGAAAKKRN